MSDTKLSEASHKYPHTVLLNKLEDMGAYANTALLQYPNLKDFYYATILSNLLI